MKRVLLLFGVLFLMAAQASDLILEAAGGHFYIDSDTGAVKRIVDQAGRTILEGSENRYIVMSKGGDVTAFEAADKVIETKKEPASKAVTFVCQNDTVPNLLISKRYFIANNGLRRSLTFVNEGKAKVYVLPMTDMYFADAFRKNVWHLGAGYIGPYKPLPKVEMERPVNEYKQSSKGMVLINPDGKSGCFSHYRFKINDTVVLPWWHSTIGHYREYADRLYYTPRGYRMGLGTLDVLPDGGSISVSDCFNCFDGDLFTFFDKIFAVDPEIAGEYASIPKAPKWVNSIICTGPMNLVDYIRYLDEMTSEGIIIPFNQPVNDWADYREKNGFVGFEGGRITPEEFKEFFKTYRAISPRVNPTTYSIVVAAGENTDILREHPEWFRRYERDGKDGSLFPGLCPNYQSMFNNKGLRDYFVDMLMGYQRFNGGKIIYVDEAQMTNTIDWQRDQITRDDHSVLFWQELKKHAAAEDVILFFNGSGQPYADMNFMESPHDMKAERWRDFSGIVLGLGLVNRMKPDMRMLPLYWSGKTDYRNRVMALGWIPAAGYPSVSDVQTIRNVWETGYTLPINVKYTPDWKVDAQLEVESHAVQRVDSSDVMLSFINRAAKASDIPVTVDLTSLQLKGRINIWKIAYKTDYFTFQLSDNELKANYKNSRWSDGAALSKPQLIYSGATEGIFKDSIEKLPKDQMVTYLFEAAPAAFYSFDNLVQNNYYTTTRHGTINGRKVDIDVEGELLLIDRDHEFYDVKGNGSPLETSVVDVKGVAGLRVKLAAGAYTLEWKTRPHAAAREGVPQVKVSDGDIVTDDNSVITIERDGVNVYTGKTPVTLPKQRVAGDYLVRYPGSGQGSKLRINGGESSHVAKTFYLFQPERKLFEKVNVKHGDVTVTAKGTYVSRFEDVTGMQRNLDPAVTLVDPEKLVLVAGASRRDGINLHLAEFAGMELSNARQINVRLTHTFGEANSLELGHVRKGGGAPETNFAGMIIDYRVNGEYVKRVAFACGLYNPNYNRVEPFWGKGTKPDVVMELGDFINEKKAQEFSLDLQQFAPENWEGELFLTLGAARVLSNRQLKLEILEFNNAKAGNFLKPEMPVAAGARIKPEPLISKQLKENPKSLKKIDYDEWQAWGKFGRLQPYGFDLQTILRSRTEGFIAHDYEYIYVGVRAYEPTREPIANKSDVCANDHVEFFMERSDKKLFQVVVDVKGENAIYVNSLESSLEGVVSHAEYRPGVGTDIFMAIPIKFLKFNMQLTPNTYKCNLYRVRYGAEREYTVWAPVSQGFSERKRFTDIIFNFE
ncbi:MAG: hypothetical protein IJT83_12245 [Victivallales bacterium]|nr:hypothetical protein [Victivallales bacterium]